MLVYRIHQMTLWCVPFEPLFLELLSGCDRFFTEHKSESVPLSILISHKPLLPFLVASLRSFSIGSDSLILPLTSLIAPANVLLSSHFLTANLPT